jgi:putative endonuclease
MLVYYEFHESMATAIAREKRLKKWNRLWKLRIIEEMNPEWRDLYDEFNNALHDGPADSARLRKTDRVVLPGSPPPGG